MKILLASELTASIPILKDEMSAVSGTLLFIPTAALGEGWVPQWESHIRPFEEMGLKVRQFDLNGKTEEETREALSSADAIYACGGNTFALMEAMVTSGFVTMAPEMIRNGLPYIGSSAGSIVAGPHIGFAAEVDRRGRWKVPGDKGLGLVDFTVMPHMDHPSFSPVVTKLYQKLEGSTLFSACYPLNDGDVLIWDGRGHRIASVATQETMCPGMLK